MKFLKAGLAVALVSAGLATTLPASAHTKLVSSSPAANATVTASPRTITLTFNEKVVPAFSSFELVMVGHDMKVPVKTTVSKDNKTISGSPTAPMMAGAYKIKWTAASADGHRMKGEVPFRVR